MLRFAIRLGSLLTLLWAPSVVAQSTALEIPSMNYWEASFDIVRMPEFRDALDISPEQTKRIKEMRSREDLGEVINAKLNERLERGAGFGSEHDVFFAVDELIAKELCAILAPEQMEKVKLLKMRFRFTNGYAPFGDPEILGLLSLSRSERLDLRDRAKDAVGKYQTRLDKLKESRSNSLLSFLSLDAKRQLVRYIGNKNLAFLEIPKEDSVDSIPFPQLKSTTTVFLVTESGDLQQDLGLTAKQKERLNLVRQSADLRLFEKQTKYKRMQEYAEAVLEESYGKIVEIIGKDKLLMVARFKANLEFEINPALTFSRDTVIEFLQLSKEETLELRKLVEAESKRYYESVKELDRDTFDELASFLPDAAQKQIRGYFVDVW